MPRQRAHVAMIASGEARNSAAAPCRHVRGKTTQLICLCFVARRRERCLPPRCRYAPRHAHAPMLPPMSSARRSTRRHAANHAAIIMPLCAAAYVRYARTLSSAVYADAAAAAHRRQDAYAAMLTLRERSPPWPTPRSLMVCPIFTVVAGA